MAFLLNFILLNILCIYVTASTSTITSTTINTSTSTTNNSIYSSTSKTSFTNFSAITSTTESYSTQSDGNNDYCDINKDCSHDRVCVDNYCRCRPNHKWDSERRTCESYNCRSNTECQSYDPNRECNDEYPFNRLIGSKCICKYGYEEDQKNQKCRKFCLYNYQCDSNALTQETNYMTCLDYVCQCKPNFRFNTTTNKCDYFECTKDAECWGNGDDYRECASGKLLF